MSSTYRILLYFSNLYNKSYCCFRLCYFSQSLAFRAQPLEEKLSTDLLCGPHAPSLCCRPLLWARCLKCGNVWTLMPRSLEKTIQKVSTEITMIHRNTVLLSGTAIFPVVRALLCRQGFCYSLTQWVYFSLFLLRLATQDSYFVSY